MVGHSFWANYVPEIVSGVNTILATSWSDLFICTFSMITLGLYFLTLLFLSDNLLSLVPGIDHDFCSNSSCVASWFLLAVPFASKVNQTSAYRLYPSLSSVLQMMTIVLLQL